MSAAHAADMAFFLKLLLLIIPESLALSDLWRSHAKLSKLLIRSITWEASTKLRATG
jgi:hypothetical protein